MKYYKVVRKECNKLYSFLSKEVLQDGIVEYKLDEFVTPSIPGSRLFVFGSLEAACRFCMFLSSVRLFSIYEVECENPTIITKIVPIMHLDEIDDFWSGKITHTKDSPECSYACDSIKLTREVTLNELQERFAQLVYE